MRIITTTLLILVSSLTVTFSQLRDYRIHQRGMLHQTVFNTGELGRAYNDGAIGSKKGVPSFEWPANSARTVDVTPYNGHYNSFGAGLYILAYKSDTACVDLCGAVSDISGNAFPVEGIYSQPISLERIENYPVSANGELNPAYNPDEAEEIIVSKWRAINTNVIVTRTSRAWSYPDYDDFIIYEYAIENFSSIDTLKDVIVAWTYALCPSMFGYERKYNRWSETDYRSKDQFARWDFKRYMSYNHDRAGMPEEIYFDEWSPTAEYGGGLNAPAAAGIISLYYDYEHLAQRAWPTDAPQLWTRAFYDVAYYQEIFEDSPYPGPNDGRGRMKQPYINRYESGNLYPSKVGENGFIDCRVMRKSTPFGSSACTTYSSQIGCYWVGRASPSWTIGTRQPVCRIYGFGPYNILPDSSIRFAVAEAAGFGPGNAGDYVYTDLGGGCGSDGTDPAPGTHPVPSWYEKICYPEAATLGNPSTCIGSDYLQYYPMPAFVNSNVVSLRDVADRAIQIYRGGPVVDYDTINNDGCGYEPKDAPSNGVYQVSIPVPAPVIQVVYIVDTLHPAGANRIAWGPQIESFSTPRLHAAFSHYEVLRTNHPLSRWTRIDSVGKQYPRYYEGSQYTIYDDSCTYGNTYYYAVVSIDSLAGRSGLTNMTEHETIGVGVKDRPDRDIPGRFLLENNYPNPFNPSTKIRYEIPNTGLVTLRVFDLLGREVDRLVDGKQEAGAHFIEWNASLCASGVYFIELSNGKQVMRKKALLLR